MTEQERPPVTVTDPRAPAGRGDVLAVEPWRPGRRQAVVAVGLAVALVVGAVTVGRVQAGRRQARQLRVALAAAGVRAGLAALTTPAWSEVVDADVSLLLLGPPRLRLAGVRTDAADWQVTVVPGANRRHLHHRWTCADTERVPTALLAELALPGAGRRTVRAPLDVLVAATLVHARAVTCGRLDPAEALQLTRARSLLADDGTIAVELQLVDAGTTALTVRGVQLEGFTVVAAPALPLVLPGRGPGRPPGPGVPRELRFALRLGPCPQQPVFGRQVVRGRLDVRLEAAGTATQTTVDVDGLGQLVAVARQERCGRALP